MFQEMSQFICPFIGEFLQEKEQTVQMKNDCEKKGWKQTLDFGFITDLYILPKKCLSESCNSTLNCFLGIPAASTTTTQIENC